jgi:hypothetical protein
VNGLTYAKQTAKAKQMAKAKQALRKASKYCEEIYIEVRHDGTNFVIHAYGVNAKSKNKETIIIPAEQQPQLAEILAGVAGKEVQDAIAPHLAKATSLDTLTFAAELVIAPRTILPKLLGFLAKTAVLHFIAPPLAMAHIGMTHQGVMDLAKLTGEFVEQAAKPKFKPRGVLGKAVKAMNDFDVTFDLANAELTPAVVDSATSQSAHAITNPYDPAQPVQRLHEERRAPVADLRTEQTEPEPAQPVQRLHEERRAPRESRETFSYGSPHSLPGQHKLQVHVLLQPDHDRELAMLFAAIREATASFSVAVADDEIFHITLGIVTDKAADKIPPGERQLLTAALHHQVGRIAPFLVTANRLLAHWSGVIVDLCPRSSLEHLQQAVHSAIHQARGPDATKYPKSTADMVLQYAHGMVPPNQLQAQLDQIVLVPTPFTIDAVDLIEVWAEKKTRRTRWSTPVHVPLLGTH